MPHLTQDMVKLAVAVLYLKKSPLHKTAEENYLGRLSEENTDVDTLGAYFCKLSHDIGIDPWITAFKVAQNIETIEKVAHTEYNSAVGTMATFFELWANDIIKTAAGGIPLNTAKGLMPSMERMVSKVKPNIGIEEAKALQKSRGALRSQNPVSLQKGKADLDIANRAAKHQSRQAEVAAGAQRQANIVPKAPIPEGRPPVPNRSIPTSGRNPITTPPRTVPVVNQVPATASTTPGKAPGGKGPGLGWAIGGGLAAGGMGAAYMGSRNPPQPQGY